MSHVGADLMAGHRGAVKDAPGFNAGRDADALRKAMKGIGTDEDSLINILTQRSNSQRQLIAKEYLSACQKELKDDLKGDLSGNFEHLMVSLILPPAVFDAKQLKKAMKILYNAGEKKWGTDEDKFVEVLCLRSFPQLRLTFDEYKNLCNKTFEESIKSEMSGSLEDLLLAIGFGAGTDEFTLTRIMVSRSDIDLLDIRMEYKKLAGESLYAAIKSDTSGDYGEALLKLCGGDD
ncbi:hypothetical protein GDO78_012202 [Eleutherodactylus coqui]|uniref:Annexin n=1 Tax=Eleutherodactylus coqui TaxID=57060 RepID=A0A8J6F344_ELECQ|nr:hypothetical protein GDO78_012202 [Eleutherodactylus coqui]